MLKHFVFFVFLVAAICATFYYGSPRTVGNHPDPVWSAADTKKIDRIDIYVKKSCGFSLIRSASHWNVLIPGWKVSPFADSKKVKNILELLSTGRPLHYVGRIRKSELSKYGLDQPRIEIVTGGGQVLDIKIGKAVHSGEGYYAVNSLNKDQLFLLGKNFSSLYSETPNSFFDLHLVRGSTEDVRSVGMNIGETFSWKISRDNKSSDFKFQFPASFSEDVKVSSSESDLLLHSLIETGAKLLVQNSTGKIESLLLSVDVGFKDNTVQTVQVFRTDNEKNPFIANSTAQYGNFVLDKGHVDQLKKTAFDMRKRNILSIETGKVGSMIIEQGNQTFKAYKSDGVWKSPAQDKKLLGIDMSLWRLNELEFEAESVKSLGEEARHVMTWKIMNRSGEELAKVEFLSDPGLPEGQCWLSVGNGTVYYPVTNKLLEDLQGQIPLRK